MALSLSRLLSLTDIFPSSIMGNNKNRAYSPSELLNGNWAISELYRTAFAGQPPPALTFPSLTPLLGFLGQEPVAGVPPRPASSFLSAVAIAGAAPSSLPPVDPFAGGFAATGGLAPGKDTTGMCTTALASWLGKPVDPADDFQCRPLNLTFVRRPCWPSYYRLLPPLSTTLVPPP